MYQVHRGTRRSRLMVWLALTTCICATGRRPSSLQAQALRQPAPKLTVGLTKPDSISYTIRAPRFRALIPIEASKEGEFRVVVSPLAAEDGNTVAVEYWLQPEATRLDKTAPDKALRRMNIGRLEGVNLVLSADLPLPGTYRGTFSVITACARITQAYTVNLPRHVNPVELTGGGAVEVRVGSRDIVIPFTLHDTTITSVLVYSPSLDDLRRQHGADTSMAVPLGGSVVRLAGGSDTILDTFRLHAGDSQPLELRILGGVNDAGTYAGTVRVAGPTFSSFTVPIKLYARESACFAALLILIGIGVAEIVRWLRDRTLPRLEQQRQAAVQLEALAQLEQGMGEPATSSPEERAALDRIQAGLTTVYQASAPKGSPSYDAMLADMGRRLQLLPNWATLRRQIETLQPPELRRDLQKSLAPVHAFLVGAGTADEAAANAAEETLHAIPGKIDEALRDHLIKRIEEFSEQVKQERAAHPSNDAFLERIEETVENGLTQSKTLAMAGDLARALAAFEDARLSYVDLLAKELQLRLDEPRPSWLEDADWARIQAAVRAELSPLETGTTPEQRLATYERSQALYLRESARTLGKAAQAILKGASSSAEEQKLLNKAEVKSQEAQSRAAIRDLHEAHTLFQEAEAAWNAYQDLQRAGVKLGRSSAPTSPASPPGGVPPEFALARARAAVGRPARFLTSRALGLRLKLLDSVISLVAALLAVTFGVYLLWEPDLTWGTTADKFAALLWGLGLQQAGNEAFRGVADLVVRIGGVTAPKIP